MSAASEDDFPVIAKGILSRYVELFVTHEEQHDMRQKMERRGGFKKSFQDRKDASRKRKCRRSRCIHYVVLTSNQSTLKYRRCMNCRQHGELFCISHLKYIEKENAITLVEGLADGSQQGGENEGENGSPLPVPSIGESGMDGDYSFIDSLQADLLNDGETNEQAEIGGLSASVDGEDNDESLRDVLENYNNEVQEDLEDFVDTVEEQDNTDAFWNNLNPLMGKNPGT
jgi:hypothetical protein